MFELTYNYGRCAAGLCNGGCCSRRACCGCMQGVAAACMECACRLPACVGGRERLGLLPPGLQKQPAVQMRSCSAAMYPQLALCCMLHLFLQGGVREGQCIRPGCHQHAGELLPLASAALRYTSGC